MANKDLLHSTGNCIPYLIIIYNGKDSEAIHLKLIQYCKSTIFKLTKIKEGRGFEKI